MWNHDGQILLVQIKLKGYHFNGVCLIFGVEMNPCAVKQP